VDHIHTVIGGRFLQYDEDIDRWFILSRKDTLRKVSKALGGLKAIEDGYIRSTTKNGTVNAGNIDIERLQQNRLEKKNNGTKNNDSNSNSNSNSKKLVNVDSITNTNTNTNTNRTNINNKKNPELFMNVNMTMNNTNNNSYANNSSNIVVNRSFVRERPPLINGHDDKTLRTTTVKNKRQKVEHQHHVDGDQVISHYESDSVQDSLDDMVDDHSCDMDHDHDHDDVDAEDTRSDNDDALQSQSEEEEQHEFEQHHDYMSLYAPMVLSSTTTARVAEVEEDSKPAAAVPRTSSIYDCTYCGKQCSSEVLLRFHLRKWCKHAPKGKTISVTVLRESESAVPSKNNDNEATTDGVVVTQPDPNTQVRMCRFCGVIKTKGNGIMSHEKTCRQVMCRYKCGVSKKKGSGIIAHEKACPKNPNRKPGCRSSTKQVVVTTSPPPSPATTATPSPTTMTTTKCCYCGVYKKKGSGIVAHEKACHDNPNWKPGCRSTKEVTKVTTPTPMKCCYCGVFKKKGSGIMAHEKACPKNPNRISFDRTKKVVVTTPTTMTTMKCRYCGVFKKKGNGIIAHEKVCPKNPNNRKKSTIKMKMTTEKKKKKPSSVPNNNNDTTATVVDAASQHHAVVLKMIGRPSTSNTTPINIEDSRVWV